MDKRQRIYCKYSDQKLYGNEPFYTCKVEGPVISNNPHLEFIGIHKNNNTNLDVKAVEFVNCQLTSIPQGIINNFPNLKALKIFNSKLKTIIKTDLKEYENLLYLSLPKNEIEFLPGNLLSEMKNLELISFKNNKIRSIERKLLDYSENLKYANFYGNVCINKCYDAITNQGNASLEKIKKEICEPSGGAIPKKIKHEKEPQSYENDFEKGVAKSDCCNGVWFDVKKILQNEKLKDFTITVMGMEFKVHKFLLAARSPVFAAIIENNVDAECLNLTDISIEIFHEVLRYIYTDQFPTSKDINLVHLFAAAGRLKLENLKNFCADMFTITTDNAFDYLNLSIKHDCEKLRQKSFQIIKSYLNEVDISDDMANQPEKLKSMFEVKKKREQIMKEMDMEFKKFLI